MKPELICPAGNWAMLVAAIDNGADAVYFGVKEFNMRATARNFEVSELKKIADYCRDKAVKSYLALNTIIYDAELPRLHSVLEKAKEAGIDAVICWDMAVVRKAASLEIPITLSTQASVSNIQSAKFFYQLGVRKIVLARELSLRQISSIISALNKEGIKLQIETFVHGAMCVSLSGRCFLSQDMFRKSANRGECLQPCRRPYRVINEETKKELLVGNNYILSPKDLCSLPFIDKLINAGISSFKIEGRNRSPEYVAVTTNCYRQAIDAYYSNDLTRKLKDQLVRENKTVYNRGFSSGFYEGLPTSDDFTDADGSKAKEIKRYVGYVRNYYKRIGVAEVLIEDNQIRLGDMIRFIGNKTGTFKQKVISMEKNHKAIRKASRGERIALKTEKEIRPNDKLFIVSYA